MGPRNCELQQIRSLFEVQLLANPRSIGLNRFGADFQVFRNLADGETVPRHFEHLQFPIGQQFPWAGLVLEFSVGQAFENRADDLLVHVNRSGEDLTDGQQNVACGFLFGDVAAGTGPDHTFGIKGLLMHGDNQNPHFRPSRPNVLDQLEPFRILQGQIHDHQVGEAVADPVQGFVPIFRFPADLEGILSIDDLSQALAGERMVIDQENASSRFSGGFLVERHHEIFVIREPVETQQETARRHRIASLPRSAYAGTVIALIDYGSGNLRSVHKALLAVGAVVRVVRRPEEMAGASAVVLPGVGAFDDCIQALQKQELLEAAREFVKSGRPFLGICVGYQALFERSEEFNSSRAGLAIFEGRVVRFPEDRNLKIPQIGWNQLEILRPDCPVYQGIPSGSYVYFVHSFYPKPCDSSIIATRTEYGEAFASSVWRGQVFATQFHPEKSQAVGLKLLRNFIEYASRCR